MRKICERNVHAHEHTHIRNIEFIINNEYKLVYCGMVKAASTTWFYHFAKLAGNKPDDIRHSTYTLIEFLHKNGYPRPSLKYLRDAVADEDSITFLIARDPFERLLSSYIDKIVDQSEIGYDKLRCDITKNRENGWCVPTFSEFIDHVIAEHASGNVVDLYWDTYNNVCTPCLVNFTHILHMNNMHEEQLVIFDKVRSKRN